MAECIILIGLQGAGKTTLYRERFARTHAHVSMDLYRSARSKSARQARELTAALDAGRPVVVDNTNPSVAVRAPLIRMARQRGAEVVGYYLEATTREAVARNRRREGRERVPDVGIFATAKRLEPPLRAEGFDRLYRVRVRPDAGFEIEPWDGDMSRFREHVSAVDPEIRYRVYAPPGAADGPRPFILFLHGRGESGRDNVAQTTVGLGPALVRHPERWPFVVALPQKPDADAPWDRHRAVLGAIAGEVAAAHAIDPARRYLTGISQGGHGTWELGAQRPGDWAALAPVCGFGPPDRYARALARTPIWCFHGQDDPIVPVEASAAIVRAIEREGGAPRLTVYPGVGHDAWEPAYADPDLPAWLLQHARPSSEA
jgi:predicted esterase/predicted kinase